MWPDIWKNIHDNSILGIVDTFKNAFPSVNLGNFCTIIGYDSRLNRKIWFIEAINSIFY